MDIQPSTDDGTLLGVVVVAAFRYKNDFGFEHQPCRADVLLYSYTRSSIFLFIVI
jgi:hypothetical protein